MAQLAARWTATLEDFARTEERLVRRVAEAEEAVRAERVAQAYTHVHNLLVGAQQSPP